jgi:hypothetical protein
MTEAVVAYGFTGGSGGGVGCHFGAGVVMATLEYAG